jgi:hypothetical protein
MATKEISILIKAKNSLAQGLTSAGKQLQAFGQSAMRIGKFFVTGFMAAGAAVAGFAAKALQAYGVQEQAEKSLVAAMNAHGQAGEALVEPLKKIAAAIQDETGAADESTLAGMARMKMLGVQTEKLGEAAKATIALKAIGMEEAAAQKAVAMAMQGNYDLLNRYVPALRQATSEEEKAAIVKDLFTKGYEQQKAVLGTVAGQWGALKGRIGDVWEEMGKAISQNGALTEVLKRAGDSVKAFGERVSEWVSGGGIVNLMAGIKVFFSEVTYWFSIIGNTARTTWAVLTDACETAFNYIFNIIRTWKDATTSMFQFVGDYAIALWEKVKRPWRTFDPPDIKPYLNKLKELGLALAGHEAQVTKRTEEALLQREMIHQERASAIVEIGKWQTDALIEQQNKVVSSAILAEEESVEQHQLAAESIIATEEQKEAAIKEINAERGAKEQELVEQLVAAHEQGASDVMEAWAEAHDVAVESARAFGWTGQGGTVSTPSQQAQPTGAELASLQQGTGFIFGSGLNPTQEAILRELQLMRQDQEQLLRMG